MPRAGQMSHLDSPATQARSWGGRDPVSQPPHSLYPHLIGLVLAWEGGPPSPSLCSFISQWGG